MRIFGLKTSRYRIQKTVRGDFRIHVGGTRLSRRLGLDSLDDLIARWFR